MFGRAQYRPQLGFTLIEMMIVLVVISVILGLTGPSMGSLLAKNRLQTAADNFYTDLAFARSEAVKRNQPLVVCKSASGTACSVSGDWEQGRMIFVDEDSDGIKDLTEPVVRVGAALDHGSTLRVTRTAFANQLTYRNDGSASGVAGDETFVFCDGEQRLSSAREILVTITGRPRRQIKTTGTCPV